MSTNLIHIHHLEMCIAISRVAIPCTLVHLCMCTTCALYLAQVFFMNSISLIIAIPFSLNGNNDNVIMTLFSKYTEKRTQNLNVLNLQI